MLIIPNIFTIHLFIFFWCDHKPLIIVLNYYYSIMSEQLVTQTQKSFQKQDGIFLGSKKILMKGRAPRYYRSIGLGFKTPKSAIEGNYVDKKCPFTGNVSIRGRVLKGLVISTKMERTIVIRRDYLHFVKKYNRFEKRHKTVSCHASPAFRLRTGDVVTVGQCRPLSKTVRFNVVRQEVQHIEGNVKKIFVLF